MLNWRFKIKLIIIILIASGLSSCENKKSCEQLAEVSSIDLNLDFKNLNQEFFSASDQQDLQEILQNNPSFTRQYFGEIKDSLIVEALYQFIKNPYLDSLNEDCRKKFSKGTLNTQLTEAFKQLKYHYPEFYVPKIRTMVSGYGKALPLVIPTDLYLSDSLFVIGLEYFMGPDYKYQPDVPQYIAKRYHEDAIVPLIFQNISLRFNHISNDQTVLSDMIFYGKSYYFVQQMIPCLSDASVLGYTQEQMAWIQKNKEKIWAHYIKEKVFYQTQTMARNDYTGEGPFTIPISQNCPGYIGRWTGLQIVKKYMEKNPELSLQELMTNKDPKEIFLQSGYKGT